MELVGILGGLDPDEQGDGAAGVLVVHGGVGNTHHHHVVLPEPRARHGRLHDDVEQDISCEETRRGQESRPVSPPHLAKLLFCFQLQLLCLTSRGGCWTTD